MDGKSVTEKFPEISIKNSEIPKTNKVSDCIKDQCWNLLDPIDTCTQEAWDYIKSNYQTNSNRDKISWRPNPNGNVLRYSFTTWLALNNKLNTKDKLLKWGFVPDDKCSFCNIAIETTRRLFFSCPYSSEIWKKVLVYLGFHISPDCWNRDVSFFTRRGRGKFKAAKARKIGFSAAVYQICDGYILCLFFTVVLCPSSGAFGARLDSLGPEVA
ncbi:uncharacterized protein LOC126662051 [Mercurialis annua]|uniref:uncharacterized protein LOC126662051 n=1 Tax=Mercurialis annua TaxID=3986 RepID=UPI00215F1190|nr:uncharacterized protein LOC126662051 [Mercurialis annua]